MVCTEVRSFFFLLPIAPLRFCFNNRQGNTLWGYFKPSLNQKAPSERVRDKGEDEHYECCASSETKLTGAGKLHYQTTDSRSWANITSFQQYRAPFAQGKPRAWELQQPLWLRCWQQASGRERLKLHNSNNSGVSWCSQQIFWKSLARAIIRVRWWRYFIPLLLACSSTSER